MSKLVGSRQLLTAYCPLWIKTLLIGIMTCTGAGVVLAAIEIWYIYDKTTRGHFITAMSHALVVLIVGFEIVMGLAVACWVVGFLWQASKEKKEKEED